MCLVVFFFQETRAVTGRTDQRGVQNIWYAFLKVFRTFDRRSWRCSEHLIHVPEGVQNIWYAFLKVFRTFDTRSWRCSEHLIRVSEGVQNIWYAFLKVFRIFDTRFWNPWFILGKWLPRIRFIMVFHLTSYVYVFLLTSMLCSVYSLPTGILRPPRMRFFRTFPSVVRQMPGYTSQRRGTARTLPN
jgi:hypothetical protein